MPGPEDQPVPMTLTNAQLWGIVIALLEELRKCQYRGTGSHGC